MSPSQHRFFFSLGLARGDSGGEGKPDGAWSSPPPSLPLFPCFLGFLRSDGFTVGPTSLEGALEVAFVADSAVPVVFETKGAVVPAGLTVSI